MIQHGNVLAGLCVLMLGMGFLGYAETGTAAVGQATSQDSATGASMPAGSFDMGDPWNEGEPSERPVHSVALSAYWIGKYEVTNQDYADMLNWANGKGLLSTASEKNVSAHGQWLLRIDFSTCQIAYAGGQFVTKSRDGQSMANHPVVLVTWYGAAAYCNWLSQKNGLQPCYDTTSWVCDFSKNGYHLPTEAQWERAAAWDGAKHYRYGTGSDALALDKANYRNKASDHANPLKLTTEPYTSPVGHYKGVTSPSGCYDMSGNAYEWCNDWYCEAYDAGSNPVGPDTGEYKVLRGGCWFNHDEDCRSASRFNDKPSNAGSDGGFRVARNS